MRNAQAAVDRAANTSALMGQVRPHFASARTFKITPPVACAPTISYRTYSGLFFWGAPEEWLWLPVELWS